MNDSRLNLLLRRAPSSRLGRLFILSVLLAVTSLLSAPLAAQPKKATRSQPIGEFKSAIAGTSTRLVRAHRRPADGLVRETSAQVLDQSDGTAEEGYTWFDLVGDERSEFIQLLDMLSPTGTILDVEVCFFFDLPVTDFTYEVVVYRNNSRVPGSLIDKVELVADGVVEGETCLIGDVFIETPTQRVFVGVTYPDVGETYIGIDTNGPFTSPGFTRFHESDPWLPMPDTGNFSDFRNIVLNVDFEPAGGTGGQTCPIQNCVESQTSLCLQNNRFKVTSQFRDQSGATGDLLFANELTPDTGYGFFPGSPNNVEVVIKVVNACIPVLGNKFWVFAGGLTDQEISIQVCDTQTGTRKDYFNPLKTPFTPITDTGAFSTCF